MSELQYCGGRIRGVTGCELSDFLAQNLLRNHMSMSPWTI